MFINATHKVADLTTFHLWFTSVKFSYCVPGLLEIISEGIHGERTVIVSILVENKKKFRNAECKVLHKLLI